MNLRKSFLIILLFVIINSNSVDASKKVKEETAHDIGVTEYEKYFFPKQCYHQYFNQGYFIASHLCYLRILSRILSLINTIVVFFIRVPQILKIIKNRSVFGLSYFGNNLEFVMPAMTFGYGIYAELPLSIYIENIFITLQSLVILSLFFVYRGPDYEKEEKKMKLMFLISILVSGGFILQLVPGFFQQISIWLQLVIFFGGRGSQLLENYRNKLTGNLSLVSMIITVNANLIRIFSIIMQAPGHIGYLLNYLIPFFVNGFILLQFYLYRKNKQEIAQKEKGL